MTNRLSDAASPYLRSHADNPVDWWAWGEEPFAEAARRDVPVFVSIGYATCHWCHVMARESFSDPELAGVSQRALRGDQGRPRGAPRGGCRLPGRGQRLHRQPGLAAVGLHDIRRRRVLRRHLLSAATDRRHPVVPDGARRHPGGLGRAARRGRGRGGGDSARRWRPAGPRRPPPCPRPPNSTARSSASSDARGSRVRRSRSRFEVSERAGAGVSDSASRGGQHGSSGLRDANARRPCRVGPARHRRGRLLPLRGEP